MNSLIRYLTAVVVLFTSSISFSAILITDSNFPARLLGASNVDVNGILYDVSFSEGSCFELFNGCRELSDFAFDNTIDAAAASQALLDQVLLNNLDTTPIQIFDYDPSLTAGCELGSFRCNIITPFGFLSVDEIVVSVALNKTDADAVLEGLAVVEIDHYVSGNGTYALWTQVAPIPVPSAFGFYLVALVTLQKVRSIKRTKRR